VQIVVKKFMVDTIIL